MKIKMLKQIYNIIIILVLLITATIARANSEDKIYIFVSLSMPGSALQNYYREAESMGAILVMRGLHHNSFPETKTKAESLKISWDIDPDLFEQYGISEVPVIVRVAGSVVKRVAGHIPLAEALTLMDAKN